MRACWCRPGWRCSNPGLSAEPSGKIQSHTRSVRAPEGVGVVFQHMRTLRVKVGSNAGNWSLQLSILLMAFFAAQVRAGAVEVTCVEGGIQPTYPPLNAPPIIHATQAADLNLPGADCFDKQNK